LRFQVSRSQKRGIGNRDMRFPGRFAVSCPKC
jgi:hypothetical protein